MANELVEKVGVEELPGADDYETLVALSRDSQGDVQNLPPEFYERANELLLPHCEDCEGSYVRKRASGEWVLAISVKTGRAPMSGDDCDGLGVASPSGTLVGNSRQLAAEFGLTFTGFEECEKGWGSLCFKNKS